MTALPALPAGFPHVSRETLERLARYADLLAAWTARINLVSPASLPDLWHRHFLDSAQLLSHAPPAAKTWVDLGSGGGFPGLVVALLAHELRPGLSVTLVESDQRKAVFLATVARETGVRVTVRPQRIESLPPFPHDVVSARALAPLPRLLELTEPLLAQDGICLFLKGARVESELTEASASWHTRVRQVPSLTDPAARLLCITEVRRAARPA